MNERVEAIRRQVGYWIKCAAYNQPLMGVEWERSENQRWLDVADKIIEFCAAALAQAEQERTEHEDVAVRLLAQRDDEIVRVRAEVERLREDRLAWHQARVKLIVDDRDRAEARTRALEAAARMVDGWDAETAGEVAMLRAIAAAIRALKDKS